MKELDRSPEGVGLAHVGAVILLVALGILVDSHFGVLAAGLSAGVLLGGIGVDAANAFAQLSRRVPRKDGSK